MKKNKFFKLIRKTSDERKVNLELLVVGFLLILLAIWHILIDKDPDVNNILFFGVIVILYSLKFWKWKKKV